MSNQTQPSTGDGAGKRVRILVVGVGALGCAAARCLLQPAVASLTLLDHDTVEDSNLQRQVLFTDRDLGQPKALAAAAALTAAANRSGTALAPRVERFQTSNAAELAASHDFIIDACDDPATKYLINAAAVVAGTPYCYGGVVRSSGQLMSVHPGVSACLACVFPENQAGSLEPAGGCSAQGILAPVAGVIGAQQAAQALAYADAQAGFTPGRMLLYEMRGATWRSVDFPKLTECGRCAVPSGARGPRSEMTCPL